MFTEKDIKYCQDTIFDNLFFLFFFRAGTGVWIRGFVLASQVLYRLIHTPSSCCSSNFEDTVLLFVFPRPQSSCFSLARVTGVHHHAQLFPMKMGITYFAAWTGLELYPSDLSPSCRWDYRCESLMPKQFWQLDLWFKIQCSHN
jgi:hypothetical protein